MKSAETLLKSTEKLMKSIDKLMKLIEIDGKTYAEQWDCDERSMKKRLEIYEMCASEQYKKDCNYKNDTTPNENCNLQNMAKRTQQNQKNERCKVQRLSVRTQQK